MPKHVSAYQCNFCAMTSLRKDSVARHEQKTCKNNPRRRTCHTCKHSDRQGAAGWDGGYFNAWICNVDEEFKEFPAAVDCHQWESIESNQ